MDIDVVIEKATEIVNKANAYKIFDAQKTAITGATSGTLTVESEVLNVDGAEFNDLITAEVSALTTHLGTLTTQMQALSGDLDTETNS